MADGTWLYAVCGTPARALPADLHGVAGEPVRSLPCADLFAVVGSVDLAEFGEEPLRRAFTDLSWVERVARAHHDVAEAVAALGGTVPFRLATIYLDDDRVAAFVAAHRDPLGAALHRVAGHAEWGVKAYAVPTAAPPTADTGPPAAADGPSARGRPGLAYLMRRREQLHSREAAWADGVARADTIHTALSALAAAVLRHPVRGDEQSGDGEPLILNAAYLIAHADAGRFADTVRPLSAIDGVRLHVTGPWAAYSFAGVGTDDAGSPT